MGLIGTLRRRIVSAIDQRPKLRSTTVRMAAWFEQRMGADPRIVSAARDSVDLPLLQRLRLMRWSAGVNGAGPRPSSFSPDNVLTDPADRRTAACALRSSIDTADPDRVLNRQLHHVDDAVPMTDLLAFVEDDLNDELSRRATRPAKGRPLSPDLQASIVGRLTEAAGTVGIQPFLMSGTLLGFVRNGHLLEHDYDIDLGIAPDADLGLLDDTVEALDDFEVDRRSTWTVATHRSGVVVDLFPHTLEDGRWWHSTQIHRWWNTPFSLIEQQLGEHRVWVPSDPERYLTENYGDWGEPVSFYEISFDTPNRVYQQNRSAIRFLHSRCLLGLERGDRWLVESTVRELRDSFGVDVTRHLPAGARLSAAQLPTAAPGAPGGVDTDTPA